jgi:hypothetical protein
MQGASHSPFDEDGDPDSIEMIDDARILHKEVGNNNNDDIYNEEYDDEDERDGTSGSGVTTFYSDEEAALGGRDDGGVLQIGSFYSAGGLRAWLAYLRRKWFKRKRLLWLLAVVLVFLLLVAIILLATLPSGNSSGSSSPAAPPVGAGYVRTQRGAVATENGLCSDIGTTIMRDLGGTLPFVLSSFSLSFIFYFHKLITFLLFM